MSKEKEIVAAEEVAGNSGVGTYKFKKPTKIDGVEVSEIHYDLNILDGKAVRAVKADLTRRNYVVAVKELDEVFHAAMFAYAADITIDSVESFAAIDYMNVADIAKDFMYGEE